MAGMAQFWLFSSKINVQYLYPQKILQRNWEDIRLNNEVLGYGTHRISNNRVPPPSFPLNKEKMREKKRTQIEAQRHRPDPEFLQVKQSMQQSNIN